MAKSKKTKLPKRIAGMKIPKELRKAGGALIDSANSPAGREAIAAGLTLVTTAAATAAASAAATMATAAAARRGEPRAANDPAAGAPAPGTPGVADPQAMAAMLGGAAETMLKAFFGARRAGG